MRKGSGRWFLETVYALFPILKDRRQTPGTALSGGPQQMVAIGRASERDAGGLFDRQPAHTRRFPGKRLDHAYAERPGVHHGRCSAPASAIERIGLEHLDPGSFNLAWKLAAAIKGQAMPRLLDSHSAERAPVAKQIVIRADQAIAEFGPIFEALGMDGGVDHDRIERSMAARSDVTEAGEKQREAPRKAIDFKVYDFDCHGVEMNQCYASSAVVGDGTTAPVGETMELYHHPTTPPARGCRMSGSATGPG